MAENDRKEKGGAVVLRVCSANRDELRIECESVRFSIPDGADGKKSGGLYGIRRGHADALMAVAPGKVTALSGGKTIFSCSVGEGLAVITGDGVTILTDRADVPDGKG
ncbi:MAG: hypothetical protein E7576_13450 [Ruminococcaceae bacterium]|jgi:hypothetical protein|nr:hypothetical protein [Oscillospiraceae bacterium]